MSDGRSQPRLVFIGGLHKSGTTLLARALAGHSHISAFSHVQRVHELTYEELVEHPQAALAGVLSFLDLPREELKIETQGDVQSRYFQLWEKLADSAETARLAQLFGDCVMRAGHGIP